MFHKGGNGKPKGFGFEGFTLSKKPEDPELKTPSGFAGVPGMAGNAASLFPGRASYGHTYSNSIGKRRVRSEEE